MSAIKTEVDWGGVVAGLLVIIFIPWAVVPMCIVWLIVETVKKDKADKIKNAEWDQHCREQEALQEPVAVPEIDHVLWVIEKGNITMKTLGYLFFSVVVVMVLMVMMSQGVLLYFLTLTVPAITLMYGLVYLRKLVSTRTVKT